MTRSDYSHPAGVSSHGFALAHFVPTTCPNYSFFDRIDSYVFRSMLSNGLSMNWDVRLTDFDAEKACKNFVEFDLVRDLFLGDFYPLTGQNCAMDAWLVYQLHRADLERGAVVALRRPKSPYTTAAVQLLGLEPGARYEFTDADTDTRMVMTGEQLMLELTITIDQPERSRLLTYQKLS